MIERAGSAAKFKTIVHLRAITLFTFIVLFCFIAIYEVEGVYPS
jgi:hypothetical protein